MSKSTIGFGADSMMEKGESWWCPIATFYRLPVLLVFSTFSIMSEVPVVLNSDSRDSNMSDCR